MSNSVSLPRDVSSLLGWLDNATPGTLVPAVELAEQIRALPVSSHTVAPVSSPEDEMLTAAEVAAWLKIDRQAVYRLAREKKLPSERVSGNTLRFSRSKIQRSLDRRSK